MSVPLSHTYAQDGEYTVTVTVNDGELESSSSAPLVVNNVAPTVDSGSEATILEGSVFDRTGSFMDPGADVWTATVDLGDGATGLKRSSCWR
jgi:PKD repeat protein